MTQLAPYVNFNGKCQEALAFYSKALNGEISTLMTFAEAPGVPEEHHNLVMHAEFRAGDIYFMASDGQPANPVQRGDNISLSLHFEDKAEQDRAFEALAVDGNVTMPLHEAFWGGYFGMLIDKFGVQWMFHCQN